MREGGLFERGGLKEDLRYFHKYCPTLTKEF